jgi:uncharacterized protein YdbL (DUF1318 family)
MKRLTSALLATGLLMLAACVTINVYFPEAAAERAADRIIDDVWGAQPRSDATQPQSRLTPAAVLVAALDFVMPVAHAQPNLDVSSPEIRRITSGMEARYPSLEPHFASGAVGLTANGDVTLRDANAVPLAQRNAVRALVNEENADRAALYRQIAVANNQPQWEAQIRGVFAERWVARARSGWWYQDAEGNWQQK